ncbi:zinc-binding dehydrogenase [Polymorphospora lycopeni]|uniref:Alcohol dehydrogenase catalytic domain-containing protein n=1 Tax=Polymorphospora lycopeni TaxID=3140240 RepID=A0ABV5D0G2_9ACTN
MKALVLQPDRTLRLVHRPRPRVTAPDDVVVRVVQTGFCGTDRGVLLGKFPAVPGVVMGHEAVGEVVEVGAGVTTLAPGDRVVANPTLYCGLCRWCRRGALNFCLHKAGNEIGIDRDGAFAEHLRLEERFLHRLPDGMSYDRAVLVEPLACVMNNLAAGRLRTGDEVVVLGGGPIGVLVALLADHAGARARLAEPDPYRRAAARTYFAGIPGSAVTVTEPDLVAARSAALVVDTVGPLLERACEIADDAGRIVVMGFHERATATLRPLDLLRRGLSVIGAGDYNSHIFVRAVELARDLPLEGIVSHHVRLDDFADALDTLGIAPGAAAPYSGMKVVITTGGGR